jgi:hypothetical protein
MATVTPLVTISKAFYAHVYEESGVLAKVDGTLYFFGDDGFMVEFEPAMVPFTTVLGQTDLADTQQILDRLRGGSAKVACHREQEVR